ncbi:nitronate monooxygenase [Pseudomonas cavernae]|uniref:Nitronate monooxygenase n=1 Tax=Pseudomonas cavernae TaxID=2320867 RepID=A0A385YY89_9PSED|nr:nitronate monooxygenase [Pseudomonas cavernae]AYC31544.1 nitronate monooxygenase [Pseudomonas cavernae]
MSTTACRLLGIQHPIIQAPMAGVSTPRLAAAVSNAGGLGSLGIGASTVAQVRALIAETRALTAQPFNLNLFCHRPAQADPAREAAWLAHLRPWFGEFGASPPASLHEPYPSFVNDAAMLELLLAERPAVVSFHFGLPDAEVIAALKAAGIVLMASATSLEEAAQVEQAGIDLLIAQGVEAGGHRGVFAPERGDAGIGTLALVRLFAQQARLPLIAAGGIMDGAGIAAALALGASAAQLGTAFILCPESSANAAYREALHSPRAQHTAITAAISGRPARGLVNRMHTEVDGPGAPPLPDYPIAYDAGKALHAAASAQGNHEFAAHWAGQGAPLSRALPAAELMSVLVEEWRQSR